MRVPVRLAIQVVNAEGAARRARGPHRRHRYYLAAYGGDVRTRDPLSLVFRGNLGEDLTPPVDITFDTTTSPSIADILTSPSGPYVYAPTYETTYQVQTPPIVPPPSDTSWWQDLSRFLTGAVGPAAVIAQISRGGGAGGATSYIIPATATSPAQRVVYNPATGQLITTPVSTMSTLPAFLQGAPGAAWYQNPLVFVGGGLLAVLVLSMTMKKR